MSKDKTALWEQWVATLSPAARAALSGAGSEPLPLASPAPPPLGEADEEYLSLIASLSPQAREALNAVGGPPPLRPEEEFDTTVARYGLVECPDGEWGAMRLFKTAEGLARRVGQLEGEDVVLWAFFGLPLRLTKGPQRYLLLPDGKAITVPIYDGGPVNIVDASLLDTVDIQEDGFVGPPELANSKLVFDKLEGHQGAVSTQGDDDDDDDEGAEVDD